VCTICKTGRVSNLDPLFARSINIARRQAKARPGALLGKTAGADSFRSGPRAHFELSSLPFDIDHMI